MQRCFLAILLACISWPAMAAEICNPRDNTARILTKPAPNAIHPNWSGDSYVGMSWSFAVKSRKKSDTGLYLKGDLISPRGGVVDRNVWVVAMEWQCNT